LTEWGGTIQAVVDYKEAAMKTYDNITPALQAILRYWSSSGAVCWIGFHIDRDKLESVKNKWLEQYGTGLSAEKRRWRREKGLPRAWACAMPMLGLPHKVEVVLLASAEALTIQVGPFSREKWITRPPEASDFVMVKEARERGDSAWTWRIKNHQAGLLESHLVALVKSGNASDVAHASRHMTRIYPAFGGVRRQLRRILRSAAKLWGATTRSSWPGQNPDELPMMVGFKKEGSS
jgi:hypothetical protein